MSGLNPDEDDLTAQVGFPRPKSKRRSSILKTRQPLSDLDGYDNDATEHVASKKSRRVSFSNNHQVREIPKYNCYEPSLDRGAEAMTAKESAGPYSASAAVSPVADGANRADFVASVHSLLLPPKTFTDQFGIYQLSDESDFKTLLNTNQNKVVATCRASLTSSETRLFANDTIETTNCYGNISVQSPLGKELRLDVDDEGGKADCTLAQSFNRTKVFGDMSMEMTSCYDGVEGSFVEESCFDQTMLACRGDEDSELDDDGRKPSAAVPGRSMLEDENGVGIRLNDDGVLGRTTIPTLTFQKDSLIDINLFLSAIKSGRGFSADGAVEKPSMPFDLKSDAPVANDPMVGPETKTGLLRTTRLASAGSQDTAEMSKYAGGTSLSLATLQMKASEDGDINQTILLGDYENDMEMTACLSKTIKDDRTVLHQTGQSGEGGGGLEVFSATLKELNSDRSVLMADGEGKMEMTDCLTKTMKLNATVLPPCDKNSHNPTAAGSDMNRTRAFVDDSCNEMSFTECLGKIANDQATFLSWKDLDRTRMFAAEGGGEDVDQTECVRTNVLWPAKETYSNWDLMETRVFSQSDIDVLDGSGSLASGKVNESSLSQEAVEKIPLFDTNDFLAVFTDGGSSELSGQIDQTVRVLEQKKEAFPDDEVVSKAATPVIFDALTTGMQNVPLCQTPVVSEGVMMKAVASANAPEFGMVVLRASNTGVLRTGMTGKGAATRQPGGIFPENLVVMVTEAAPVTGVNSSSCATHSFTRDLASKRLVTNRSVSVPGAEFEGQVHPGGVIATNVPVLSAPEPLSAGLPTDRPGNQDGKSIGDINLPWYTNPRMPLSEMTEEEDMDVDVTVNLTKVKSRSGNRSTNEQVLREEKNRSLPVVRVDRSENSALLTRNLSSADDMRKNGMSLHTSENLKDFDKPLNERVFGVLQEGRDRSLAASTADHHESAVLPTGISSLSDERSTFWRSEVKKGISGSLSEQVLAEIHKDRSRNLSLGQVEHHGKFTLTDGNSLNVGDRWKLETGFLVSLNQSLAFEGKGQRKRCIDASEESLEKEPKRRSLCEAEGFRSRSDGGALGSGADNLELDSATSEIGRCTEFPRKAEDVVRVTPNSFSSQGLVFPSRKPHQQSDFGLSIRSLPRQSLPVLPDTSVFSRKDLSSSIGHLKDSSGFSANLTNVATGNVLFDRSMHLNRLDITDFENVSHRGLLDMISFDQSALLKGPAKVAVKPACDLSSMINDPMFDSEDEEVERTRNHTDMRITSAFNLSKFELPEKWNRSTLDCSGVQYPLLKTADDLLPKVAPSGECSEQREAENSACVPMVTDANDVAERENCQKIPSNEVKPNQSNEESSRGDINPSILLPEDCSGKDIVKVPDQQLLLPIVVVEPEESQMSVADSVTVAEEPKALHSQDEGDLTPSIVINECFSERPENVEKQSSTQNSVQPASTERPSASKCSGTAVEEVGVFATEELRLMDAELKQIYRVKDELMKSLVVSLAGQLRGSDKFSVWDLDVWKSSGCTFSFLCETLVLDVSFGSEVMGVTFCNRPARAISTLTLKSNLQENMWPECKLAHLLFHESVDASVLRLYRDTSQLDKVLRHILIWILQAERVRKDICDLDPLHICCRVEIEGQRVAADYSSARAHVSFRVACEVHLPRQLDTCPAWTFTHYFGHIREEEVFDQIKQVEPGFYYLGDVFKRIQKWLDTLGPRDSPSMKSVECCVAHEQTESVNVLRS